MKIIKFLAISLLASIIAISCDEQINPDDTKVAVERISVSPTDTTLTAGDTLQLTINVYPETATNKTYTVAKSATKTIEIIDGDKVVAVKAGEGAIVTVVSNDDNSIQATCMITVVAKENTEPGTDEPGKEEPIDTTERLPDNQFDHIFENGYRVKLHKTTENDIWFAIDFPEDAGDRPMCFMFAEPKSVIENMDNDELITYTKDIVIPEISKASGTYRLDSLMDQNAISLAGKDLVKLSVITTAVRLGGQAYHLRDITPATEYRIFGIGVDENGEFITDAFWFDESTTAPINENSIIVEYTTPYDIVIDVNVLNKEQAYWLHYRPAEEMEGISDEDLFQMDSEVISYYANMNGLTVGEYISTFGTRGNLDNFHLLSSECLTPNTDYVVYFYGVNSLGQMTTEVYKANAKTQEIVPSGVTFTAEVDYSAEMPIVKVTPSDENVYYILEGVLDGKWSSVGSNLTEEQVINHILYGTTWNETDGYIGALIGNASFCNDYSSTTEGFLVGTPDQRGQAWVGTYNGPAGGQDLDAHRNNNDPINMLYTMPASEKLHVVAFTIDHKTGAITSDPKVIVIVDATNQ